MSERYYRKRRGLLETSEQTAARFRSTYRRRRELKIPEDRESDADSFREVVLNHIGRLSPKWPKDLLVDVEGEWGPVGMRRLMRALSDLVSRGDARRTDEGYLLCRRSAAMAR